MAAPNSYALESLRFPGYFVEACDVGSLVDRTHGSLRLLRVAPSNDDSDEMSGGGVSAHNTRRFGKRSESGSGSAVDASTSRRYDPPTETWFTWDFSKPGVGALWREACTNMTGTGAVDGCFMDGCSATPGPVPHQPTPPL